MKNVKYILNDNDPYDYHRLQEKLTRFAAEGWHLEKISNLMMKFRRGEPKQVRYEITYSAAASAYNSQPTEEEQDLADLCAEAGWELAAAYAQLQIYRNEDPNAPPLETDEVQKYQNIRRNIMKHQIPHQLMMIALFTVQFLLHGSSLLQKPASILSSSIMVLVLAGCVGIVIEYSILLAGGLLWLRKAGRAVEEGLPIPPNLFYRRFRWVMWASSAIFVFCLMFGVKPAFGVTTLVLSVVMVVITLGTLAITKRLNASKTVNTWAPALVAMAVILLSRPLLSDILFPAEPAVELPLTLTQLTGENSGRQLTIDVDSSPLVSHGRYYDFGGSNEIQYTLVDVHCPLFYDIILNDMEQDYLRFRPYQADADIPDELRELVGADYIRRSTSYLYEDCWFICWDDRILDIYADWVLTDEQVAALAAILKPR